MTNWKPWMQAARKDVFPNDREDAYVLDGRRVVAHDVHVIDPGAESDLVRVGFLEGATDLGLAEVRLADGRIITYRDVNSREVAFVERLWACFRRRHRVRQHLVRRNAKMLEVGAEAKRRAEDLVMAPTEIANALVPAALVVSAPIVAPADRIAPLPARSTPPRKAGRNDPCPCGSGRKFKKCCITKGIFS